MSLSVKNESWLLRSPWSEYLGAPYGSFSATGACSAWTDAGASIRICFQSFMNGVEFRSFDTLRSVSGLFLLRLASAALGFGVAIYLARTAGVVAFGAYAYCTAWITILGVPARFSFDTVVTQFAAKYSIRGEIEQLSQLLRFTILAAFSAGLIVAVSAATAAVVLHGDDEIFWVLLIALGALIPMAFLAPISGVEAAKHRIVSSQAPLALIQPMVFFAMLLAAQSAKMQFTGFAVVSLYTSSVVIAAALAGIHFISRRDYACGTPSNQSSAGAPEIKTWLRSAVPLTLTGTLFLVNANADVVMLGLLRGEADAAIYKAATRGAELIVLFLAIINAPLGPIVAKEFLLNKERLQATIRKYSRFAAAAGLSLALVLIVAAETFLALFGSEFKAGTSPLRILCLGQGAVLFSGPATVVLAMTGNSGWLALWTAVAAATNVSLNLLLIPEYGITGAAAATSLSTLLWALLLITSCLTHAKINPTAVGRIWKY